MTNVKQAWDEVGDAFESLALKLKLHFEQSSSATSDSVKQAIDLAGDSIKRATEAIGTAVSDEGVKADSQRVGTAVANAISATFSEVSEKIRSSS